MKKFKWTDCCRARSTLHNNYNTSHARKKGNKFRNTRVDSNWKIQHSSLYADNSWSKRECLPIKVLHNMKSRSDPLNSPPTRLKWAQFTAYIKTEIIRLKAPENHWTDSHLILNAGMMDNNLLNFIISISNNTSSIQIVSGQLET